MHITGTITVNDSLDLLAEFMGCGDSVAAVTNKASQGGQGSSTETSFGLLLLQLVLTRATQTSTMLGTSTGRAAVTIAPICTRLDTWFLQPDLGIAVQQQPGFFIRPLIRQKQPQRCVHNLQPHRTFN